MTCRFRTTRSVEEVRQLLMHLSRRVAQQTVKVDDQDWSRE
jgi:hypothetical protein